MFSENELTSYFREVSAHCQISITLFFRKYNLIRPFFTESQTVYSMNVYIADMESQK